MNRITYLKRLTALGLLGLLLSGGLGVRTSRAADTTVDIVNFTYRPEEKLVNFGSTVTWTNRDIAAHTVTFDDGSIDSGVLTTNQSFSHTLSAAGLYSYHCTIHPSMKGTIRVLPAGAVFEARAWMPMILNPPQTTSTGVE